jgi:hypothetical protein
VEETQHTIIEVEGSTCQVKDHVAAHCALRSLGLKEG